MQLALGVMTALYARERTGRGQEVNTSALGAMMWIQAWEIAHSPMSDEPLHREGQHNPNIRCPYGVYETNDGGAFMFVVAMSDESWDEFWLFVERARGRAGPAVEQRRQAHRCPRLAWTASTRSAGRCAGRSPPRRPRSGWRSSAANPRSSTSGCRTTTSSLVDPQVVANGYLADVEVPGFGTAQVVTNVVHLSDTPGGGVRRPPPLLGEHTAEVMTELGFDATRSIRSSPRRTALPGP